MFYLPVILGSTRRDRQSPKVANYVHSRMKKDTRIETEILDLQAYNFPIMEERLSKRDDPPPGLVDFSQRVRRADGLVIVTPEYNQGYPGVLKNALDYLYEEYERKPFGIVTVSAGGFGGINCLAQLRLVTLALGGVPIPESLAVSRVNKMFDEKGEPTDPSLEGRTQGFLDEMLWWTEAVAARKKSAS